MEHMSRRKSRGREITAVGSGGRLRGGSQRAGAGLVVAGGHAEGRGAFAADLVDARMPLEWYVVHLNLFRDLGE